MKTLLCTVLLATLFAGPGAQAETTPEDRQIIEKLNNALDVFGTESHIRIRYRDVVLSTSRVGRYFTFKSPTIIHNVDGMHYELSTRGISLREEEGIWYASVPPTLHLTRAPENNSAAPEKMVIRLYGSPLIKLKMDAYDNFSDYDIDAAEKIEARTREELETGYPGAPVGTSHFNSESIETDGWQEITPIPPELISRFLQVISTKDK